jgi:hypothetical protein
MKPFDDELLRRVLEAEAATVEVQPQALPEIRRRIAARRAWWPFPRGGAMLAFGSFATAAATVVAVFVAAGSCAPPRGPVQAPPAAQPTEASPTPGPTAGGVNPAPTGAPTTGAPGPERSAGVYVYYVGDDRGQQRLYREIHQLKAGDGGPVAKTRAALTEMLAGRPYDPDYVSKWPSGVRVRDVRIDGATVVVDLAGAGTGRAADAGMAVAQLVWTATANADKDSARILLDGAPAPRLWNGTPIGSAVPRGRALDVLGLVWVIDPQQNAVVNRTFQVFVAGIAFEATVHLRVKRGATVVDERFVTLNRGAPEQGEAKVSLTLPPGTYTIEGYEVSPADGSEQHLDNHQFTVR